MRNSQHFRGTGVALVTPFKNHKIDFDALAQVIEHTIAGRVDFLVSLGTTGESVTLTKEEKKQVIRFTIKQNNGRLPVVVGIGGNNTGGIIDYIKSFDFTGVDAILSNSPAYNKPTQEGLYQHYMAIEAVTPVPIILYNVPGRTSSNMDASTTVRLAKASEKFIAIKDATNDLRQGAQIIKDRPEGFLVLSGDDETSLALQGLGSDGLISVIGNAYPREFADMTRAALNGDFKMAQLIHRLLLDVHYWLYVEGNPAGVKACLEIKGLCSKEVRLPLVSLSDERYLKLKAEMDIVAAESAVSI